MRCLKFPRRKDPLDILTNRKGASKLLYTDTLLSFIVLFVVLLKMYLRYHEAGYDALITGRCFLSLCQRLGRLAGSGGSGRILPNSPLLQPYLNKAGSYVPTQCQLNAPTFYHLLALQATMLK